MNIPFHPVLANLMGPQALFILFVLLLLFGAKKLPELARGLGQAIREFSKAKNDIADEIMRETPPRTETPRQIDTPPVQTTAASQPVGAQPAPAPQTVAQQPAAAPEHTGTHA